MKKLFAVLGVVLALAATPPSQAALYNFDVLYSGGGVASLVAGSNNPTAVNLASGDNFNYRLIASGSDFWSVISGGSFFPLFSLPTLNDSGTRTANFTLTLSLDGATQFVFSEFGITNSFVHIGTNTVDLATGLQFDQMFLEYNLLSSTNVNNRPTSLLPWPGQAPEQFFANRIAYNVGQVPEPASLVLLGLGFGILGFMHRRAKAV